MLRGVGFVENAAEKVFLHFAKLMDIAMFQWYVDDVELNYIHFREGKYSGSEFKDALGGLSSLSFARIRRYPPKASIHNIDEYNDYIESECDSLFLFYDGGYFELYAKDPNLIHTVFKLGSENGFDRIHYIDDDARSWMHF